MNCAYLITVVFYLVMNCTYLITVVFYQFFNSVNNEEMFIFVVMPNISSVEPAIAVNCLSSGFWVVEVTCNNIRYSETRYNDHSL